MSGATTTSISHHEFLVPSLRRARTREGTLTLTLTLAINVLDVVVSTLNHQLGTFFCLVVCI